MNYKNIIKHFKLIFNILTKDLIFSLLIAIILVGLFNDFSIKNISAFFGITAFILIFLFSFLLLIFLSFNHKLLKFVIIILLFFSTINIYVKNKYGFILDETMIANGLDSLGHINDVTDYNLLIYFLFFTIIPSLILLFLKLQKFNFKSKIYAIISIIIILSILLISLPKFVLNYSTNSVSPASYISSFFRYYQRFSSARIIAKNRQSLTNFYDFKYLDKIKNSDDELKIVIVIGESLRADHLQIFGYNRPTTPFLKSKKNLLKFNSQSFYTVTTPAITDLLSHRLNTEFMDIPPEKTIIELMKKLDFKTHWFSMQSSKQFGTEMLNIMAMEADEYFFRDRLRIDLPDHEQLFDGDLLPYFTKAISEKKKSFILLHSFGSHTHYFERFPENFKKYSDQCRKNLNSCNYEQIANAYDNSVLYTDFFLNEVIKIVDQHNAILFYISDHGAFLGENGIYANGSIDSANDPAHKVPLFIYYSEKLQKNVYFQQKMINAKNKQHKLLNPDNFFDSVLDCSSIESSLIKKRNLSVCRK